MNIKAHLRGAHSFLYYGVRSIMHLTSHECIVLDIHISGPWPEVLKSKVATLIS